MLLIKVIIVKKNLFVKKVVFNFSGLSRIRENVVTEFIPLQESFRQYYSVLECVFSHCLFLLKNGVWYLFTHWLEKYSLRHISKRGKFTIIFEYRTSIS
jgi:hypothetical protein